MKNSVSNRFRVEPVLGRAAFTRGEVIALIAIIAIVTAILYPMYLSMTNPSKPWQNRCLSNLKELGLAFQSYAIDYDEMYPTYDNDKKKITGQPPEPEVSTYSKCNWIIALDPYLRKKRDIVRCPADTSLAPADPAKPEVDEKKEYASSYSVNGWSEYHLTLSAITSPGAWVLLGERNNQTRGPNGPWLFYFWTWQGTPVIWPPASTPVPAEKAAEDLALTRHSEGANWLYGDGHVKWGRFPDLWKGGSDNPFWPSHTPSSSPSP